MSESKCQLAVSCGIVLGMFLGLLISGAAWHQDKLDFRKQAIERRFAECKTDSDGVTVFTWKDAK